MKRFAEWLDAYAYARRESDAVKRPMLIRKVREFGSDGYNLSFAAPARVGPVGPTNVEPGEVVWPAQGQHTR